MRSAGQSREVEIRVLSSSEAALRWDEIVQSFQLPAFEQGYRWGEYRDGFGWCLLRCVCSSPDGIWAVAQCLVKKIQLCRIVIIWIPGGPLLKNGEWLQFREKLAELFRGYWIYVRVDPPGPGSNLTAQQLMQSGWKRARRRLNSGQTMVVSLTDDEVVRRHRLSSNWRHNLARGLRQGMQIERWAGPDHLDALAELYQSMVELKGIPPAMDKGSLQRMTHAFEDRFLVMIARNAAGQVIAARGAGWVGLHAHDMFAATSEEGRKCYASYVTLWRLLDELKKEGVQTYDLGGVDQYKVPGVFNFKRGVGGVLIERSGEWEWSQSAGLRWAVNAWVWAKAWI